MWNVIETRLPGVVVIESPVFRDDRGHFEELWRLDRFAEAGLPAEFAQDNLSYSTRGVLRGLHYQHPSAQGKLVAVLRGAIFDVAVDLRQGSPQFGQWVGVELVAGQGRRLYVPEGFAHGFVVTDEEALVLYKCTQLYAPQEEGSVLWNDPDLGIQWPIAEPRLSAKDRQAPRLSELPDDRLPRLVESEGDPKPPGQPSVD